MSQSRSAPPVGDEPKKRSNSGLAHGRINKVIGRSVTGWLYSPTRDVTPVLIVDGRPASLAAWPTARPDVAKALGVTEQTGFEFQIDGVRAGAKIELFALIGQQLHEICHQYTEHPISDLNVFRQLDLIAKISRENDAVAITSWDGAHNPIGRAKVLHDIVHGKRPAAIVTYLFRDFGGKLWQPLAESDIALLTIPWEDRARYHRILRQMEVNFPTVWICKPRLPNFELASQIAASDAKLILDLDDNDDHFSESLPSRTKIYGAMGLGQSKYYRNRILARTVASTTLRDSFGGEMVRHARVEASDNVARAESSATSEKHIGFIGTVRSHKNLLTAAKSISVMNWRYKQNIQFHVYGDVQPESLKKELLEHGVKIGGIVPAQQLYAELSRMDVILTGFPSSLVQDGEVTKYQISSKIGDGLAVNRPVLVPRGPSVADLEYTPGVFIFDEIDFPQKVLAALAHKDDISLPPEFTLDGAYEGFDLAEVEASKQPRAAEVFANSILWQERNADIAARPTLLLLWKQHDAGIYGRRVDQVARAYKNQYPDHNVRILEFWHERQEEEYKKRSHNHLSDAGNVLSWANRKTDDAYIDMDGVSYDMIEFRSSDDLEKLIFEYLTNRDILPSNTLLVLFPFIKFFEKMQDLFSAYSKIVDVVDNQLSWSGLNTGRGRDIALQYNTILPDAKAVVFNSSVNMRFFQDESIVADGVESYMIPNWYTPPAGIAPFARDKEMEMAFNVVYSGNMNDRIDWDIIRAVAAEDAAIVVHLVGAADRAPAGFFELLKMPNVLYHGPQSERFSLALLASSQLAIMPHLPDDVSNFMNPMKLHMYQAASVPVIATQVQGIDPDIDSITVSPSVEDFVENVRLKLSEWTSGTGPSAPSQLRRLASEHQDEYLRLIQSVAPWRRNGRHIVDAGEEDDASTVLSANDPS